MNFEHMMIEAGVAPASARQIVADARAVGDATDGGMAVAILRLAEASRIEFPGPVARKLKELSTAGGPPPPPAEPVAPAAPKRTRARKTPTAAPKKPGVVARIKKAIRRR